MISIISNSEDLALSQLFQESSYSDVFKVLHFDTNIIENFKSLSIDELESNLIFDICGENYKLEDFDLVWYKQFSFNQKPNLEIGDNHNLSDFYENELKNLHYYFHYKIYKKCKTINSPFKGITNKLLQLDVFRECGFKIPRTYVYTGNIDLRINENQYITKGISIPPTDNSDGKLKIGYTSKVEKEHSNFFKEDKYFPTLIQKKIKCQSELRVFYFLGKFYAINILVDRVNFVDYRSTNYSQEYNSFPVELSPDLKEKLNRLMNALDLDSGSIDILIDENDACILLEVNKYGQFGMINDSSPNFMLKTILDQITKPINT